MNRLIRMARTTAALLVAAVLAGVVIAAPANAYAPPGVKPIATCRAGVWTKVDVYPLISSHNFAVDGDTYVEWNWYGSGFPWFLSGHFTGQGLATTVPIPSLYNEMWFKCRTTSNVYAL